MQKTIVSLLLILCLLLPSAAFADCGCETCESCECEIHTQTAIVQQNTAVLIAKSETYVQTGVYIGASWWALTDGNRAFGKISPAEDQPVCPAKPPKSAFVGGCMDNGLVRKKGSMTVLTGADGLVYGLTSLDVKITLNADAVALVESIVRDRLEVDGITANAIIAATMWWQETTVTHIFFHPTAPMMWVGVVTVNGGRNTIDLWAGDWDGDGFPELGFCAGSSPTPVPTAEPTPEPTPVPVPESTPAPAAENTPAPQKTESRECSKAPMCVKNYYTTNIIQINNQVNIKSKVTNCQKVVAPVPSGRKGAQCIALGE